MSTADVSPRPWWSTACLGGMEKPSAMLATAALLSYGSIDVVQKKITQDTKSL